MRRPLGSRRGPKSRLRRLVCLPCCSTPTTPPSARRLPRPCYNEETWSPCVSSPKLSRVADEDTKNKLGDCLYDDQGARWASVWSLLDELPDGGQGLREYMIREQEHRREVRLPSVEPFSTT